MTGNPENLRGRTAVITGAAGGIGLAMAETFGRAGMRIVASDIDDARLAVAVSSLHAAGIEAIGHPADVSRAAENEELAQVADDWGPAHVVCLNAGVVLLGRELPDLELADWEWVLGVNLWGPIHGTRAFLRRLLARDEGHLVYSSSLAALLPATNPYQISKHGVHALAAAVRATLAARGSGVGSSVLFVGPTATDIASSWRQRPDRWASGADTDVEETVRLTAMAQAHGMPPAAVADLALTAVVERREAILTDPSKLPAVAAAQRDLLAALAGDGADASP